MNTNITQVLKAIKILADAVPNRDAAGKIEIYVTAKALLHDIEQNLDPKFIHHNYTRENLGRVDLALSAMCGFLQLGESEDLNLTAISDRLGSALGMLSDPSRWPSTCTFVDENGEEKRGTNDPR